MKEATPNDVFPYLLDRSLEGGFVRCAVKCEQTPNSVFATEDECLKQCGMNEVASFVAVNQFMKVLFAAQMR